MELELLEMRKTVRHGYQVLLTIEAEICLPTEAPKIRAFYQKLAEACLDWAQNGYGEQLKNEFSALESNKERAQFRAQKYQLRMRKCFENQDYIAFLCESALMGRWSGAWDGYRRISHVWNKAEELLLPQAQILRAFGFRLLGKDLPFHPDGIYPEGDSLVLFRNANERYGFLEKKFLFKKEF